MIDAASDVARRLLAGVGTRLAHSQRVASQAEVAAVSLDAELREVVRAAAWLHDVGYSPAAASTGFHPLDGARWLRKHGFDEDVCSLVAWHTAAGYEARERGLADELRTEFARPDQSALDVVTWADLTSSPTGEPILPADRLQEILTRYPSDSPVHRAIAAAEVDLLESVRRVEASRAVRHG
jgi:putative nucleotidyltransferase with HDIG domain